MEIHTLALHIMSSTDHPMRGRIRYLGRSNAHVDGIIGPIFTQAFSSCVGSGTGLLV